MKAIILNQYGGPEVLEWQETAKPLPQAEEVLIKTTAIGINYASVLIRQGKYRAFYPLPAKMPAEIEGVIEAVGANVKHLTAGQRVTGIAGNGYAAFVVINAKDVFLIPPGLPPTQGLLSQGLTARYLLEQAKDYQSVIITAAASGVGSFAVQLARLKGGKNIIALAGNKEKVTYAKSLGATYACSYFDADWQEQVAKATNHTGADLILDAIGGDTGTTLAAMIAPGGTMVAYGNMSEKSMTIDGNTLALKANRITGASIYHATPENKQQWWHEMVTWIQEGKLKSEAAVFPYTAVAAAFRSIESRNATGRVVLTL